MKYRLHRQRKLNAEGLAGVPDLLSQLREGGFGLDLMLSDTAFNREIPFKELEDLQRHLSDEQVPVTCHLPYVDLRFGSRDARVHEYARDSLQEGLEMASVLRARMAVLHLGFSNHIPPKWRDDWRERVIGHLREMIVTAEEEEIIIAIENTYEADGEMLQRILDEVGSPWLRFCADLGHANCYSRMAPEEWISVFQRQIVLMHFHDNDGLDNLHNACGDGVVGYDSIYQACEKAGISCPIVLEVPDEAWDPSIEHLREVGFEFGEVADPVF